MKGGRSPWFAMPSATCTLPGTQSSCTSSFLSVCLFGSSMRSLALSLFICAAYREILACLKAKEVSVSVYYSNFFSLSLIFHLAIPKYTHVNFFLTVQLCDTAKHSFWRNKLYLVLSQTQWLSLIDVISLQSICREKSITGL